MKKVLVCLLIILLAGVVMAGCSLPTYVHPDDAPAAADAVPLAVSTAPETDTAAENTSAGDESLPQEAPPPEQRVTLMAVGDIMVHQAQLEAAWDPTSQTYQFDPFFARVKPILQSADLVVGNLETTLAGKDLRFTGYPQFNSPESLASALKAAGFTALTTANNHSLDRREAGVLRTLQHLDQSGLAHTGTFRTPEERNLPLILEKNGIRLGLIAYTYGTNGIPLPKGKPYLVNLIQPETIQQDIATARAMGVDLVAVSLHFGAEYQRLPNQAQRTLVDQCFSYGADLILGHHPHVLQPYEWRTLTDEAGRTRKGLVIYSLGNFISAQRGDYKDVGGILSVTLLKRGDEPAVLEEASLIPTYVHYNRSKGKRQYVIYPLAETLDPASGQDPQISTEVYKKMERLYKEITIHTTQYLSEKKPG
ncbi:CapA family protein [Brevibacillus humidisoli]|uniref:CapA family protein n=1 Tax=Brevibacillus humidisoli TaxID=2895522 RepID=UPI001E311130|nr:CapA family protein [Brevibacillus humidisoli]UFJ41892.1 CapA family protein [Brevibacillus humidisoli]